MLGVCGVVCMLVGGVERVNVRSVVYVAEDLVMAKMIVRMSDDILGAIASKMT